MVQPALCGRCGAPVGPGSAFCSFCGVAFVGASGGLAAGSPPGPPGVDPEVVELLRQGNKIGAIKAHRTRHNCDLRTAKDAVETLEKQLAIRR